MADKEQETGTSDLTYDLISVIYHALQGAETYGFYFEDARESGDKELQQFFRKLQQDEARRADRARELLKTRL